MKVLCFVLLGCLAAHAAGQALPTYQSPGLDFSLIIPGWNYLTFGPTQKTTLCNYITNSWQALSQGGVPLCTVYSVGNYNGTSVVASGNAYFTWPNGTPNAAQVTAASNVRDNTVAQLTTNTNAVIGTVFPGTIPNCACNALEMTTASATQPFTYNTIVGGVPGPMLCGARLTYNSFDQNAVYTQVGVDDGSNSGNQNFGKYCSNPAVAGGVTGLPGQGACRQYGVITSGTNGNEAIVAPSGITMGSGATRGSLASATPTYPGSGFQSVPAVTVSFPDPLPASAYYTLNANAQPSGLDTSVSASILTPSNGPYVGDYVSAATLSQVCVDAGAAPPAAFDPNSALCTGTQTQITALIAGTYTTVIGYLCTVNDFNTVNAGPPSSGKCGSSSAFGGKRPCAGVNPANGVLEYVGFPGSANVYCSSVPAVTFSTATLQVAQRAQVTAQVVGGQVVGLPVISGGSGYRSPARITIAPPASNAYGKLCSPNPIPNLSAAIAYPNPLSLSMTGECQPFGRNTQSNKPCSEPAVYNGEWIALDTATCNVQSSFINQPGSSAASNCGILAQSFVMSGTPAPPPPPSQSPPVPSPSPVPVPSPSPSPSPTPDPSPSPTPRPSPSPQPAARCVYDGVYRLESAACSGNYLSYSIGSKSCNNDTIQLQTSNQAKPPRINWRLDATAIDGKTPSASVVSAVGRLDTCKNTNLINLGAVSGEPTPQLAGQGWKIRVIPTNIKNSCNYVRLQAATGNNNNGKYLSVSQCGKGNKFSWKPLNNNDNKMQWKLRYLSN